MKVGVFHVGTQHSWQTARAFQEEEALAWYATSVFYKPEAWPYRIERWAPGGLAARLHREFTRRHTTELRADLVHLLGPWEWPRTVARRLHLATLDHWANVQNIRAMARNVISLIQKEPVDLVWGYNSMSAEIFRFCRSHGIPTVLDQTIGHPRAQNHILLQEQQRAPTYFPQDYRPYPQAWIDDQDEEMGLADVVVCGSEFCAQMMLDEGCSPEKVRVLPYGFDAQSAKGGLRHLPEESAPIRFLFVGAAEARKGIAHLIEAFLRIPKGKAELTIMGRRGVPESRMQALGDRIRFVPQVPREAVGDFLREADCFVFPSLFEGSALVLQEAIGAGLGIIQTRAAGRGVDEGRNGIEIDELTPESLHAALEWVIQHREVIPKWSRHSLDIAPARSWEHYRERCRALASEMIARSH